MKIRGLLWFAFLLVLNACANVQPGKTDVVSNYHYAVVLESQSRVSFVQSNNIKLEILKHVLTQLTYCEDHDFGSKSATMPVFQADEIDRLAPALQQAANRATPGQWVRFVSYSQKRGTLFTVPRKTEGVLFLTDSHHVNIAFNYINTRRSPSETSVQYHQYARVNPLDIDASPTSLVVTEAAMSIHMLADGHPSPLWVEVDFIKIKQQETEPIQSPSDDFVVGETSEPNPSSARNTPEPQVAEPSVKKQRMIKQQLEFLKKLHQDGLISDTDYEQQKSKVLDLLYSEHD
nr:SHOCT domain-containing protein [uncultured Desulfuromonas sp.]